MTAFTHTPAADLNLYVAFHIPDDVGGAASVARLLTRLEQDFGDQQAKVLEADGAEIKEVIFRIQKPLLEENEAKLEFFQKLKELFIETSNYKPHFTQVNLEVSRGAAHS